MTILVYAFSFAICGFDLNIAHSDSEDSHSPIFYCAGDLNVFIHSGGRSSSSIILASYLSSFPPITEPYLPILSHLIFRPPQTAKVFLQV
jgi:hypothetical protein